MEPTTLQHNYHLNGPCHVHHTHTPRPLGRTPRNQVCSTSIFTLYFKNSCHPLKQGSLTNGSAQSEIQTPHAEWFTVFTMHTFSVHRFNVLSPTKLIRVSLTKPFVPKCRSAPHSRRILYTGGADTNYMLTY